MALFFASGFVALLYQVIWQRLLGLVTGLDLHAVTLIVAVFMLGMGLGSLAGGALADRLQARSLLLVFAAAEIIVAMFALVSKPLYHDLLYGLAAALAGPPTMLAVAAASTLLVPTFFMGVTLPVLSKALSESVDAASLRIGSLYGWNTLGAAMGAWAGSAVLVRTFGYERSLWIGAAVNLSCAGATLVLVGRLGGRRPCRRRSPALPVADDRITARPAVVVAHPAGGLLPLRFRRARPRDGVVSTARRRAEIDRVHVSVAAWLLPPRRWRRQPGRPLARTRPRATRCAGSCSHKPPSRSMPGCRSRC